MNKRITKDRANWMQTICDIRIRPNLAGLTEAEAKIAESIYTDIPQYRFAAKQLAATGWYRRAHVDYSASLYRWDGQNLVCVASHISKHRIRVIRERYEDYAAGRIDANVWQNYCTGGYTTRVGLDRANNNPLMVDRIAKIAQSHADCLVEGKAGHDMRVAMRNP